MVLEKINKEKVTAMCKASFNQACQMYEKTFDIDSFSAGYFCGVLDTTYLAKQELREAVTIEREKLRSELSERNGVY